MPLQNRVMPDQRIVADPSRGLFTGSRGILHDDDRTLRRRWTSKAWICCALQWKGTRRTPMTPHTWTELFFLDEAVALAAGHRPCATCRRAAYVAFRTAWDHAGLPGTKAPEMDSHLHAARLTEARTQRRYEAEAATLPDGTFIWHRAVARHDPVGNLDLHGHSAAVDVRDENEESLAQGGSLTQSETPHLILGDHAFPFTPSRYLPPVPRPEGSVLVLTPRPMVAVLQSGYEPILHASAFRQS